MVAEKKMDKRSRRRPLPLAPAEGAQLSSTAIEFAAEAKDLKALRRAVVDAASVGAGLWFSYLFVLLYLLIGVGAVTHRDLLYVNPVKLPFLNVDLPLIGFFVLGPLLFLIVHAYVLLHFVLLADKVGAFHAELDAQIADDTIRVRLRRQLPSNIFVQFLAGPREVRTGIIGIMLRLIAQISLVAGPLALLVLFQLQFLPYHQDWVTWWQRLAVVVDVALLWMLWPSVARGKMTWITWRDFRRVKVTAIALMSLVPFFLVFTVATFPGEWLEANVPTVRLVPTRWPGVATTVYSTCTTVVTTVVAVHINKKRTTVKEEPTTHLNKKPTTDYEEPPTPCTTDKVVKHDGVLDLLLSMEWTSIHKLLVAGDIDFLARKPRSPWSNRLVLPSIDVSVKPDSTEKGIPPPEMAFLRGRRLEGAILLDARLRRADFRGARLNGAMLDRADLREANFDCDYSGLFRFSFGECTHLEGTSFGNANLQGATFRGAELRGASFMYATLKGASFLSAHLPGSDLSFAHLDGAELDDAELQGANLNNAELQAASLSGAKLQGTTLNGASLQGATLDGAELLGASFDEADLRNASFNRAQLQGASFNGARLQYASLVEVFNWRTNLAGVEAEGTLVSAPESRPRYKGGACPTTFSCEWSGASLGKLKDLIAAIVPEDRELEFAVLDPRNPVDWDKDMAKVWDELEKSSPSLEVYQNSLAVRLRDKGCSSGGTPDIIRGLIRKLDDRFGSLSSQPAALAAAFLDDAHCQGTIGLSEEDKARLRNIRDRVPAPSAFESPTAKK